MITIQQLKCPSCNADIEYIPGKGKHCSFCGAMLVTYDENKHEFVYNDVASVKQVELDEKKLQYVKEKDALDRRERKEYFERNRKHETFRIKVLASWIGISTILLILGVVGITFDVKLLILLLGISVVSFGIGFFILYGKKNRYIWKICFGFIFIGIIITVLYYKKEVKKIEMPTEYIADMSDYFPEISAVELQSMLSTIGEFATSEYMYSGYAQIEKYREIWGVDVPLTSHRIGIYYNGKIKVGYTISEISVSVDNRKIIVSLPSPMVLDNYIENYKTEEENNIFNPINASEVWDKLEDVKVAELNKAVNDGLYNKADSSVKVLISDLFSNIENSTIVFK